MEIALFEQLNGPCPYLPAREWVTYNFFSHELEGAIYETLISKGFRRSGISFYLNRCPGCTRCIPLRVDVESFQPSRSQKRAVKKNRSIKVTRERAAFDEETFELYRRYSLYKHVSEDDPGPEGYIAFLIDSPVETEIMRYYLDERLVGAGWIDILPNSISSVYFAYEPELSRNSLGVYSVIKEIELCRELNKSWLQMGFWVEGSEKMAYKSSYSPHQLLIDEEWEENRKGGP